MQEPIKNLSPGDIMKLSQSDAGQQLLALLKQEKSDTLKQAMDQAAAGNMDAMKQTLSAFRAAGQTQELLKQLRGQIDG